MPRGRCIPSMVWMTSRLSLSRTEIVFPFSFDTKILSARAGLAAKAVEASRMPSRAVRILPPCRSYRLQAVSGSSIPRVSSWLT